MNLDFFLAISWETIPDNFISGLIKGSTYALIALGYSLVYGILKMINFAHGEVFMIGGYTTIITLGVLFNYGLPAEIGIFLCMAIALLVSMILCSTLGYTIERVAYRPLRQAHVLSPLISAIGMSIFLQNFIMLSQGNKERAFPNFFRENLVANIGIRNITYLQVIILIISVIMMVGLYVFIMRTKMGKAMRAVSMDQKMAQLVGINPNTTISLTFIIGSALAATGGFLMGMYLTQMKYDYGYLYGMKAFTCAVLGGIGNIPGAMLGGLIIGVSEEVSISIFGGIWKDIVAFVVLLLILIFKPRGILGEKVTTRA